MRLAVIFVVACSGSSTPVAVPVLPDVPYALLDRDQRAKFMEERVVPMMAPLFRAHDGKRYAEFGCTTCHAKDFVMPNAELPKLDVVDLSRHDRRAVEWMTNSIAPAMARLLGDAELSCLRCHVREIR